MDSYSDDSFVDDELFIGPVTTEYTKKLLLQTPQLSDDSRRKTFSGVPTPVDDLTDSSEYFTPDSTFSRSNTNFLDKMRAVLDEPSSSNNSYRSAYDRTINDISIAKRRSSLPKRLNETLINDMDTLSLSRVSTLSDDIVISDNEIDDDFLRYQGTQIKYENITAVDIDDNDDETSSDNVGKENEVDAVIDTKDNAENCVSYSLNSSEASSDCYENKHDYQQYDSYKVPNVSISSNHSSTNAPSYLSTSSTTTSSISSFKEPKLKPSAIPRKREFLKPPMALGREVLMPKNTYGTPTSQGFRKPALKKSTDKFKHVQSPVSFYIKNSATAAIRRNAHIAKLPAILPNYFFENIPDISHRWEFIIPDVIYKPSAVQYKSKGAEIHLPRNIRALIPTVADMYMNKHESRIKGREDTTENIRRKLYEDMDLTMNRGPSAAGAQDISIVHVKPYF